MDVACRKNLNRGNTILYLVYTDGPPNVHTVLDNFPDSHRKMVSCFLHVSSRPRPSATTTRALSAS